jgi:endonuclease-3
LKKDTGDTDRIVTGQTPSYVIPGLTRDPHSLTMDSGSEAGMTITSDLSDRIGVILDRLAEHYAEVSERYLTERKGYLQYGSAWQLLFATILSAQCTDARVNMTTPVLFERYPDLSSIAGADIAELEAIIHPCGFYHTKAEHIIGCAKALIAEYGGEVPSDLDQLTKLPGVGRKTANVLRGMIYQIPSIVVDTHVLRVSSRLGITTQDKDAVKAEFELMAKLPQANWILYNIQIIAHGRAVCKAPTPKCDGCFLRDVCEWGK